MGIVDKKRVFVPPDGGWGYLICIAVTIIYTTSSMFMTYFGQVFDEFIKQVEMSSSNIGLMNSLSIMSAAIASFITSPLLKILSKRKVAFIGAISYNLGIGVTVFVNTQINFIIFQGIVQCFGMGLLYNLGFTIVNEYFVEKRFLVISIIQSVTALVTMLSPYLISWSLDEYGYRGTLVLISGISLQTLLSVALLQPVQWHMKELVIEEVEEIKLLAEGVKMADKLDLSTSVNVSGNDGSNEKKKQEANDEETTTGFLDKLNQFFNLTELKSFCLSNALMGTTLIMFSDITFSLMLPQALQAMDWDEATISNALFLSGLGDMVTRVAFIFLNKWLTKMGCQEVYVAMMLVGFMSRLGMLWSESPIAIMSFITLIGSCRCAIMILPPLIIAEVIPAKLFSSAMGLSMLATGITSLLLGPAIGTIRDLTGSYPTAFYILSSFFLIVVLFWTIEICYKRNKHRRHIDTNNIK